MTARQISGAAKSFIPEGLIRKTYWQRQRTSDEARSSFFLWRPCWNAAILAASVRSTLKVFALRAQGAEMPALQCALQIYNPLC